MDMMPGITGGYRVSWWTERLFLRVLLHSYSALVTYVIMPVEIWPLEPAVQWRGPTPLGIRDCPQLE